MISEAIFEANMAEAVRGSFTLEDGITRFSGGSTGTHIKHDRAIKVLRARASGMAFRDLKKHFGVSHHTINAIIKNRPHLWEQAKAHVKECLGDTAPCPPIIKPQRQPLERVSNERVKQFCGPVSDNFLQDIIKNMWPVDLSAQGPGLYFLYLDSDLVYVGQSTCVAARTASHLSDRNYRKQFNRAMYVPMEERLLLTAERAAIRIFSPKYNVPQTGARPSRLFGD